MLSDVDGAQQCGMKGLLVKTGKLSLSPLFPFLFLTLIINYLLQESIVKVMMRGSHLLQQQFVKTSQQQ